MGQSRQMTKRSGARLLAVALAAWLAWACEPFAVEQTSDRQSVAVFKRSKLVAAKPLTQPPQLRVVAWNIKYGAARIPFWFDCWGDRVQMSKAEVESNLKQIYALLNELDADVLMVEEIEVNSRRSAYVDMVRGILENTSFNYAAYYGTWNSQYVASEGVGRIDLGNAIFSKYPIVKAESIRQADRTDQDPLTQMFYIHRAIGRAEIELQPGQRVAAYVVHTEAYDNDGTKQKQIQQIYDVLQAEPLPRVVGGDFNELPPNAARVQGFPDERETSVCSDDFKQPPYTPQVMQQFYDTFVPWVPLDRYGALEHEQQRYFTHSVLGPDDSNDKGDKGFWNRTLDYLFVSKPGVWASGSTDVLQQAGQRLGGDQGVGPVIATDVLRLSDHAPVVGTWEVRP